MLREQVIDGDAVFGPVIFHPRADMGNGFIKI